MAGAEVGDRTGTGAGAEVLGQGPEYACSARGRTSQQKQYLKFHTTEVQRSAPALFRKGPTGPLSVRLCTDGEPMAFPAKSSDMATSTGGIAT